MSCFGRTDPGRASQGRLQPGFALAHHNLGAALLRMPGRLPEAIEHYKRAVRLDPNFALAYNNLGAALILLEEALRQQPDFPLAQQALAELRAMVAPSRAR